MLNVGIVKQPLWVYLAIAMAGIALQGGVVALAGAGVWVLGWNLSKGSDAASRDYAPVMFIASTMMLCSGTRSCAFLIGHISRERRFRRAPQDDPALRPRLFWLQPGPQVIGDQSFDPFGYYERDDADALDVWMSSEKRATTREVERKTTLAVAAVLVGYVMQFIGLRGMTAWVSLAQLVVTVIMSLLRGLLRMRRLGKDANQLDDKLDLVSGHELDWLSSRIAEPSAASESPWHMTGRHERPRGIPPGGDGLSDSGNVASEKAVQKARSGQKATSDSSGGPASPSGREVRENSSALCLMSHEKLFRVRVRLAHLTGHACASATDARLGAGQGQQWKDEYVKVRAKARDLAAAVSHVAMELILEWLDTNIELRVSCRGRAAHSTSHGVGVTLYAQSGSSHPGWLADSAQLEAILGLWMWTLVSDERLARRQGGTGQSTAPAEEVACARLVAVGQDGDERA